MMIDPEIVKIADDNPDDMKRLGELMDRHRELSVHVITRALTEGESADLSKERNEMANIDAEIKKISGLFVPLFEKE